MNTVTTPEVRRKRDEGDTVLINVLPRDDYEAAHIPGSLNIPYSTPEFAHYVEEAAGGKETPIVVYCADETCGASEMAAKQLDAHGFTHVSDYDAGLRAWRESDLPVTSHRQASDS